MKKQWQPRIPQFSTKKKLSNFFWIYPAFILIAVAFMGVLLSYELSRARVQHVQFFNFQAVNFDFLNTNSQSQDPSHVSVAGKTPVFVFEGEKVLIGQASEIYAPRPAAPILRSSFQKWESELNAGLKTQKLKSLFSDATAIGVSIAKPMSVSERAKLFSDIRSAVSKGDHKDSKLPSIVLLQPTVTEALP